MDVENVEIYGSIEWGMNRKGVRFRVEVIKEFVCMDVYEGTQRRQYVNVSNVKRIRNATTLY